MIHATDDDAANAFKLARCARVVDGVQVRRGKVRVGIVRGCIEISLLTPKNRSDRLKRMMSSKLPARVVDKRLF